MDLAKAAYSDKTPYDLWQEQEEIPILRGHYVEDLRALAALAAVADPGNSCIECEKPAQR